MFCTFDFPLGIGFYYSLPLLLTKAGYIPVPTSTQTQPDFNNIESDWTTALKIMSHGCTRFVAFQKRSKWGNNSIKKLLGFNYFYRICGNVMFSYCVSVQAFTFECLNMETSFLEWWYNLTVSRSSLSTKDIGSRSRSLW